MFQVLADFLLQVPYIASALGDVELGADGHKDPFDWLSRQLTKVDDQPKFFAIAKTNNICSTGKTWCG